MTTADEEHRRDNEERSQIDVIAAEPQAAGIGIDQSRPKGSA